MVTQQDKEVKMTKREYNGMMATLYKQLHKVEGMSEQEACWYMSSETKEEGLQMIKDVIESYKKLGYK